MNITELKQIARKKLKKKFTKVRKSSTTGIKHMKALKYKRLLEVLDWLEILAIVVILGLILAILVPLTIIYGLFMGAIILWEEYGIREQSSNSSR